MNYYCNRCKEIHQDNELCPHFKKQLKQNPELLSQMVDFVSVAGQYKLVSGGKLIDKIVPYETTHQMARDIEVFKRLNDEFFIRAGHFNSPDLAKVYYNRAINDSNIMKQLNSKLTGASQEVDWIRMKKGEISSLWEESYLLNRNAPGIDGETISKFTGKPKSRTTIKASANPISDGNLTGVRGVEEAIEKGYATEKDIIFGNQGTKTAASKIGLSNPVVERGSAKDVQRSNQRLINKMGQGKATTTITTEAVRKKVMQGAVIGAAISLTVSSITSYMRYKNGELSMEEAFFEVGEETAKGTIVDGGLSGMSLFLPIGMLGFVGNVAIGVYIGEVSKNILDEVFGKGAYGEILNSSGCTMVSCLNLKEFILEFQKISHDTNKAINQIDDNLKKLESELEAFDKMMEE